MAWIPQNSGNHFEYGAGSWSQYYWNPNYNPNATIPNCLANCTTLCYGRALENGWPAPVTSIPNGNKWHTVVNTAQGWSKISYTSGMQLYAGDIVEWASEDPDHIPLPNHVATIEQDGTDPYQSSSWYTGDDGTGNSSRNTAIVGHNLQAVSNWMVSNYPYRFYHYSTLSQENIQGGHNNQPRYVLRYQGAQPPTPSENPVITIVPTSYYRTMAATSDYLDFQFSITISGIPDGESASGGNTYPDLTRIYNSGWSYTSYVINGVTYRQAYKQQTLRYYRVGSSGYNTTKHMYFNLTFSNGSITSDTPMYITVKPKTPLKAILGWMACRGRRWTLEIK